MARKVFISFLGTNNYVETHYELNGIKTTLPVRFVQEALIDSLCKNWSENDAIIIFFTEEAKKKNWLDDGHEKVSSEIEKKGLRGILKSKQIKPQLIEEETTISDGFSKEEIWDIFNTVYNKLEPGDEIDFDVTHAFRSIPLFSTVLFNFAQFLKNTRLVSIHYGAFEKLGPAYKVKELPVEQRVAPIVNLTELIELQKFTSVTDSLIRYGKISGIGTILPDKATGKLGIVLNQIKTNFDKLEDYILTNRMTDIRKGIYVREIRSNIKSACHTDIPNSEKLVLKKMEESIKEFVPEDSDDNIKAAINWAFKYDMLVQAYTLSQEYIISLVCNMLADKNPYLSEKEKKFRIFVSSILGMNKKDAEDKVFKDDLKKHDQLTVSLLELHLIRKLRQKDYYKLLADNRNILNHAKGDCSAETLKTQFESCYQNCLSCCNSQSQFYKSE
jgi:CRISPR-associated Csx2 family protein